MPDMAFLLGALFGTFVISRLFWVVARGWPNSIGKAIALNVFCAAALIPIDYIVRGDLPLVQELIIYGGCQTLVLIFDVVRIMIGKPARSNA